ncbi:MAG TPA: hypothetical protein VFO31_07170 [Vicinamibacterales bacterium]|nr:hypothetical protein [Vicinamibacterales bacterium]
MDQPSHSRYSPHQGRQTEPGRAHATHRRSLQGLGGSVRFVPDAKGIATQMILTIVEGDIPVMRKP